MENGLNVHLSLANRRDFPAGTGVEMAVEVCLARCGEVVVCWLHMKAPLEWSKCGDFRREDGEQKERGWSMVSLFFLYDC